MISSMIRAGLRAQKFFIMLVLTGMFTAMTAQAAVPHSISYQGILKDSSGNYLTGTYSIVFKIYSASSGGTALWTETQSSVSVSSGKFSVQLGSVTSLDLAFDQDYWLGIKVGSDSEMTPRVKLTSVGYAYMADQVVNAFTQTQHDALSHRNVAGVKENATLIAKTNFKLDSYTLATANNMSSMIVDTFTDASGIASGSSSNYAWRGSTNYDVIHQGAAQGIDDYTVLMLHSNGTDAATTFTDSSSHAHTMTASGNAQLDTAQTKFGSASGLFDGASDYVSATDSDDWDFGTGDFTIDFWYRFHAMEGYHAFFDTGFASGMRVMYMSSSIQIYMVNSEYTFSWSPSTGQWYHVAIVRNGSNLKVFVNGAQIGSTASVSGKNITGLTSGLKIGFDMNGYYSADGWFDEYRVSKGIARWTDTFSPPTSEYSAATTSGTGTVISNAYTLASAPTETMVTADETLNTGSITYSVSRDNGTTWTTCTKETVCSISSQPSGTQLKWKAVITDDAELNGIAVTV